MEKNNFLFFWGGFLSQWYICDFVVNNTKFNCAEQYMMAYKALFFKDFNSYNSIMKSKNPYDQKSIGRKVNNFDVNEWEKIAKDVVIKGNYNKFNQNDYLKKYLINTGSKELVEASPYDKIWGIGLKMNDYRCLDKTKWLGKNWLGECLMEVRNIIINESK